MRTVSQVRPRRDAKRVVDNFGRVNTAILEAASLKITRVSTAISINSVEEAHRRHHNVSARFRSGVPQTDTTETTIPRPASKSEG